MIVPAHSLFKIYSIANRTTELLPGIDILIDQDITLPVSSNFGSLYKTPDNTIMDIANVVSVLGDSLTQKFASADTNLGKTIRGLGNAAKGVSGRFKEFGFQIYKGNEPLKLSLNLSFNATYNAKIQVYDPVMKFMMNPLPSTRNDNKGGLVKMQLEELASESTEETVLNNLIPPGPSATIIFKGKDGKDSISENKNRVFNVQLGDIYIPNVFITGATPTFSKEKMKVDNKFYPMSCKLALDISTVFILTRQDIYDMQGRSQGEA